MRGIAWERLGRLATAGRRLAAMLVTGLAWLVLPPLCGLAAVLTAVGVRPGNYDDSMILFVYVRHLRDAGRFYWNAQDGNVDGFTSMLDLLAKTAAAVVLPGDIVRSSWIANTALHAGCGVLGALFALLAHRRFGAGGGLIAAVGVCAGAAALASNPAVASGSAFILETPLYVFTVLLAVGALLFVDPARRAGRVGLAASWLLMALARPEGAPLTAVFALAYVARAYRQLPLRQLAEPLLLYGGVYLAYLGWHSLIFGSWAPNTYYAKLSDHRWNEIQDGKRYLKDFAREHRGAVYQDFCLAAPILVLLPWRASTARWGFAAICGASLLSLVVLVWSGGDCYPGDRFFAAPVTLMALSATVAAVGLRGLYGLVPAAVLLALVWQQQKVSLHDWPRKLASLPTWSVSEGSFRPHKTVAGILEKAGFRLAVQNNFQMYKYFSDVTQVLDATGLNDRQVAHMPWPGQNLWGKEGWDLLLVRRPEVVSYGFRIWSLVPMANYTTRQIADTPELYNRYAGYPLARGLLSGYRAASVPDGKDLFLSVFVREDLADRARAAGILVSGSP